MRILILVLSYDDSGLYTEFYKTQKQTWDSLHVEGVDTYYYFGNSDDKKIDGNNIFLGVRESLMNCAYKTIDAFDLVKDFDFDFIFRTNSSSYVDKKLLKKYVENKSNQNFYSGIIGNHMGIPFCSGSGYFLSKDLVKLIINNKSEINHNLIDDVAFGNFLKNKNIEFKQSERFDVINNDYIPMDYFHYRLKTSNRQNDIKNMELIFLNKCK